MNLSLIHWEIERQHSLSLSRILMSQDEITVMDGGKCIFQLRGVRPFLSDKYDITKHKNYRLLEDYDKKNLFDIESYMKRKGKGLPLPCPSQEGT